MTVGGWPLRLAIALASAAAVLAFGVHRLPGEMRDFEVYWTAASRALHAEPLYRASDGHYQFKYLPAFAVASGPIALLPLETAKACWFVVSAGLLPLLVALSIALLPERRRPAWALGAVGFAAMAKFFGHELVLGQVNILFAVVVCAAVLLLRYRHDAWAAALLVVAIAVKPYAIVFLPWLAATRGRAAIVTGFAALAALLALPAAVYGPAGAVGLHQDWWLTVTRSTAPNLTNNDNVSLAGMFAKWLGAGTAASVATLATSCGLLALAAMVIARGHGLRRRESLEGALLLMLVPLVSPQGWDYVFLVATPAVVLFANDDDRLPPLLRWTMWIALGIIGLSLFDLMGRERYATFMSWSVITWCFVLLVAALASLRQRRIA